MYCQFNNQQCYVLPTQCIYVFCVDLRTNSDYFPKQHWLVIITQIYSLLRGTDWICKCNSSSVWSSEQLVVGLSRRRSGFHSSSGPVRFVLYKLVMEQLFLPDLGFALSVSFHHCSILIFVYVFLLPEGQMTETWDPCGKQWSFGNRGTLDRKYSHSLKPKRVAKPSALWVHVSAARCIWVVSKSGTFWSHLTFLLSNLLLLSILKTHKSPVVTFKSTDVTQCLLHSPTLWSLAT